MTRPTSTHAGFQIVPRRFLFRIPQLDPLVARVGHEEDAALTEGDRGRFGELPRSGPFDAEGGLEVPLGAELLNAVIPAIDHVDTPARFDLDPVGAGKLARPGPRGAE